MSATARRGWRRLGAVAAAAACGLASTVGYAGAATITIVNADSVGEGFNDPTPVAPVTGNAGTTLGQQRLNAFAAAAAYWANRLSSPVAVRVVAAMNPLACTPTSALLGQAGTAEVFSDFPGAPLAGTWYPAALGNALGGSDFDTASEDIDAAFNSALDNNPGCLGGLGWFYAVGQATPPNRVSFYEVVRHELGHGLGFATLVNAATGARLQGMDDVFMTFLEDHSTGKLWSQMSNGERATSAHDPGDLHWVGPHAVAASGVLLAGRHPSGHVQMYAPATLQPGSSVAHWDTALFPNEVMEPFATPTPSDIVTTPLLQDIGWALQPTGGCVPDADTACLGSGRFDVSATFQTSTSSGQAQVMSFGGQRAETDESVFFWFFGPSNFEIGVKLLDACTVNGEHWVFVSGLTDQGWMVTVRDTQTGVVKTYSNAIGHLSTTFADTVAFSCP